MLDVDVNNFDRLRIGLASSELIREWSRGEVKKPETINYRTLKPEKDGLFCEKIFGPTKDWECYCGKYKRVRFKGIICERCGVEVTRAKVRRDRMGHIELAAPVSHIWYFKGVPSRLGYLLDIAPKDLEKVLYFASSIITSVNEEDREADLEMLSNELEADTAGLDAEKEEEVESITAERDRLVAIAKGELEPEEGDLVDEEISAEDRIKKIEKEAERDIRDLDEEYEERRQLLAEAFERFKKLAVRDLISDETLYREMKLRYGDYFRGGMGAEAVKDLLQQIDLDDLYAELRSQVSEGKGQKRHKALKRLKVVASLKTSGNKPQWMILDAIPVIPPDLRPMVQLDGGRFATSDLNDLYRRVINRNNRLKRLLDLGAPEIIVNNEKRMLQEAVDALFDNGRRGRPVTGPGNRPLKSLADMLKGKQGRFRQNLLGKRVDYSGRSVIVVGPELRLHQCGLPKAMALELFKPFVMKRLVDLEYAQNIKSAKRMVDRAKAIVWDVLDEVISDHPVLLNRAPTLHRLGIQAFEPVLVEGKAIRIHPLVCTAFNADFDGDQMAVHLPLSAEAQAEARVLMLATNNVKSPAHGRPLAQPTQDMVIGLYYLTAARDGMPGDGRAFMSFEDAVLAYDSRSVDLQATIECRLDADLVEEYCDDEGKTCTRERKAGERLSTTVGRITFNRSLPEDYPYVNRELDKKGIGRIVEECSERYSTMEMANILDELKRLGFHYATRAGVTVSVWDAKIPEEKADLLAKADAEVLEIERQYDRGLITSGERHRKIVEIWNGATDAVGNAMADNFDKFNPIYMMAYSGARGNIKQIRQLAAMRGLMTKPVKISEKELALNPYMEIMDRPIKSNFREGLSPLEYFVSANGARKGLADTALRTADSGYLTRRLVDVAQDVIVREADCGTDEGLNYPIWDADEDRVDGDLVGRYLLEPIVDPKTGEVLKEADTAIESSVELERIYRVLKQHDPAEPHVTVRTVMTCHSRYGVCQKCYGWDLAAGKTVEIGTAVGIIAAQSIGEPGTQLTMRTFHTGGVAGGAITQGLPRVTEVFEARKPTVVYRGSAYGDWVSPIHGTIRIKPSKKVEHSWEVKIAPDIIAEVKLRKDIAADEVEPALKGIEKALSKKKKAAPWVIETSRGPRTVSVRIDGGHMVADERTGKDKELTPTAASSLLEAVLADAGVEFRIVVYKDDKDASGKRFETQELTQTLSPQERDESDIVENARVTPGTVLRRGGVQNPHMMLLSQGREAVFKYIVREVQKVYRSQGVDINDKHIEVIARQMTRKVEIQQAGDTDLLPGQVIDRFAFEAENERAIAKNGMAASASTILLGITKASLATDSYLSAASFQETTRVLTDAAIAGKEDQLLGLKENVIIGKLIPAATGMRRYRSVMLTYKGQAAEWSPAAEGPLPEFAPEELRELEAMLPGPAPSEESVLSEEDASAFFAELSLGEGEATEEVDVEGFAGAVFEPEPEAPEPEPAESKPATAAEAEVRQCEGIRADGSRCTNKAKPDSDYCGVHAKQAEKVAE